MSFYVYTDLVTSDSDVCEEILKSRQGTLQGINSLTASLHPHQKKFLNENFS
jgi:hypothetical protein